MTCELCIYSLTSVDFLSQENCPKNQCNAGDQKLKKQAFRYGKAVA